MLSDNSKRPNQKKKSKKITYYKRENLALKKEKLASFFQRKRYAI